MSLLPETNLKLTGAKTSWCALRVIAVLHELGMEPGTNYTFHEIDMAKGAHKSAAHKALQPLGKVPVPTDGDDDGFLLFESGAISRYVTSGYGGVMTSLAPVLLNASFEAVARFEQAACVEASSFDSFATRLVIAKFVLPLLTRWSPDKKEVATWKTQLAANLDVLDDILSKPGQRFMTGESFSLVDVWYCPLMHMLFKNGEGESITKRKHIDGQFRIPPA